MGRMLSVASEKGCHDEEAQNDAGEPEKGIRQT